MVKSKWRSMHGQTMLPDGRGWQPNVHHSHHQKQSCWTAPDIRHSFPLRWARKSNGLEVALGFEQTRTSWQRAKSAQLYWIAVRAALHVACNAKVLRAVSDLPSLIHRSIFSGCKYIPTI